MPYPVLILKISTLSCYHDIFLFSEHLLFLEFVSVLGCNHSHTSQGGFWTILAQVLVRGRPQISIEWNSLKIFYILSIFMGDFFLWILSSSTKILFCICFGSFFWYLLALAYGGDCKVCGQRQDLPAIMDSICGISQVEFRAVNPSFSHI